MASKSLGLSQPLYDYLLSHSLREPDILKQLRQFTANHPQSVMQIAPEQGQFMALLIRLIQAKKVLEIGVFTGYSSLSIALALPQDGTLIACDISEEFTVTARSYWQKAQVDHKISLHIAPALETLDQLLANGQAETFDFVFIDADKQNYLNYYQRSLQLIRSGGLIVIDNVLWNGAVADPQNQEPATVAIRQFNETLLKDTRIDLSLVPIADGLTLILKP